jgi:hypothetical protein
MPLGSLTLRHGENLRDTQGFHVQRCTSRFTIFGEFVFSHARRKF